MVGGHGGRRAGAGRPRLPGWRDEIARLHKAIAEQSARLAVQREAVAEQRREIAEQRATLELLRQTRRDAFEHAPLILKRLTEIERVLRVNDHDLHRPPRASRRRPLGL